MTFFSPTALILVPIYLLADLAGTLNSQGQVAHAAHLGGWTIGLLCGYLISKFQKIRFPFFHPSEERWTQDLSKISNFEEQQKRAKYLLDRNRENRWARECLVRILLVNRPSDPDLRKEMAPLLSVLVRENRVMRAIETLEALNPDLASNHYVSKLNPKACRKIFFEALNSGHTWAAFRALTLYKVSAREIRFKQLSALLANYLTKQATGISDLYKFNSMEDQSLKNVEALMVSANAMIPTSITGKYLDRPSFEDCLPARFNQRFLAILIDGGLTATAGTVAFSLLLPLSVMVSSSYGPTFLKLMVSPLLNIFIVYLLIWRPTQSGGQSIGKRALHIQVIESNSLIASKEIRWSTIILREVVGKFFSFVLFGFGYLMALGSSGLALHDRLVGTRVIQSDD